MNDPMPCPNAPTAPPSAMAPVPPSDQGEQNGDRGSGSPNGAHQHPPTPRDPNPDTPTNRTKTPTRATINIASLNINGYTAQSCRMTGIEKWSAINRTMSDHKIAIMALQETHLDQALLQDVENCFGRRLTIVISQSPTSPRATAGVAFVINKALISPRELHVHELISGRAMAIKIKWRENEEAVPINVYAPNDRSEHKNFWTQVESRRRSKNIKRPDFLLGDFNVTEDPLDRALIRPDDPNAIEALRDLRHRLDLQDTWRHCHEMTARAARLEQGVSVALSWIGFAELRGEQGSLLGVA